MRKRAKLTEDQIKRAALDALSQSDGWDTDELRGVQAKALDYYYTRADVAPVIPGRASIQSADIADMVEAVTSQIMPALEMDLLAMFEPLDDGDVDQALVESQAVSWVIMRANNGYTEQQASVRNALLLRNGINHIYLDSRVSVDTENYKDLTNQEYAHLSMGAVDDLDAVDNGYTVSVTSEHSEQSPLWSVRVVSKETRRKVIVEAVDPTLFNWESGYDSLDLQGCNFVCERSYPRRSELLEQGYPEKKVAQCKPMNGPANTANNARNPGRAATSAHGATSAEDVIETYKIYQKIDADGDGYSELKRICIAGDVLLHVEDADLIPYAAGTAYLQPHRFLGLGLFDKLKDIQDAKTDTLRQWIDNQKHANNARVIVVDGDVNIDDAIASRPGGVVRASRTDAVIPFPYTDIGPSCESAMNYLDKARSERGGASLDMQRAELQIAGDSAHGVERQMTAKEQMAAHMTRSLAETLIRNTWILTHKVLRLSMPDPLQFRVSGNFQSTVPAEWRERETVEVKAGISMAERLKRQGTLETVIARQDALRQMGAYVSPEDAYNAHCDWLRVQGINDVERYLTDPRSEEAQQHAQAQQQAQQQQQAYQGALLQLQRDIEDRKADNADAKVLNENKEAEDRLAFEYWKTLVETERAENEQAIQIAGMLTKSGASNDEPEGTSAGVTRQ